jgi:hypothetical protein
MLDGLLGMSSIQNDAQWTKKLLLKTQVSEKFFFSEVNLIIQYIIVQHQDGKISFSLKILHGEKFIE